MTARHHSLSILREPAWTSLVQRLDALAAGDKKMSRTRDTLLRPLRLLQILAAETPGALAQDVLAAERLRNLLYLASPWGALVPEADQLLDASRSGTSTHEPGVIDLGAVVLVALAGVRVAPNRKLAAMFLQAVHGLALSATPAEMLGQMEPYGHEGASLREVVKLMVLPEAGRLTDNRLFLPRFALDPLTLGRWLCLRLLLGGVVDEVLDGIFATPLQQYAASADGIESLRPADARPGDELTLTGRFPELSKSVWPKALHVVFASATGAPAAADVVRFAADAITVRVPADAEPGWIGIADDRHIAEANRRRKALRAMIAQLPVGADGSSFVGVSVDAVRRPACLDEPISAHWIPDLHGMPVPPRTAANRYIGGGSAGDDDGEVSGTKDGPPRGECDIVLFRPAIVHGDGARANPEALDRIGARWLGNRGLALRAIELPWVEDSLAVLSHTVRSADDPRIARILDRLSATALRTPGAEHALWLVLVPGSAPVAVFKPAEAAAAVAVATVAGLPSLFEKTFADQQPATDRAPMDRLRIIGQVLPGNDLRVHSSRLETGERVAGRGAPVDSGFVAVGFDAADREVHRQPIRVLSEARPSHFGLLFPITPEVARVEIQKDGRVVRTIRRIDGLPQLIGPAPRGKAKTGSPSLSKDVLRWNYRHSGGVRSDAVVEVSRGGVWTPFTGLDACRDEQALPLHRLQQVNDMRVVASDGWNATARHVKVSINGRPPVVARRVNATEWWADVGPGWEVVWTVEGLPPRTTRLLDVPSGLTGAIELTATEPKTGKAFTDRRYVAQEEPS